MKNLIIIAVLTISLLSCKENTQPNSNVENINVENLVPGPIVHKSLNEDQLNKIKFIQETFYEVNPVSLEETVKNFKRDQNPDKEIKIWLNMAQAFQPFVQKNQGEEKLEHRKEAFKLVLMRSMMSDEAAISNSELKLLNDNEIQEILKNYALEATPVKVESK